MLPDGIQVSVESMYATFGSMVTVGEEGVRLPNVIEVVLVAVSPLVSVTVATHSITSFREAILEVRVNFRASGDEDSEHK